MGWQTFIKRKKKLLAGRIVYKKVFAVLYYFKTYEVIKIKTQF